jgi:hypothetical protein
MEDSMNEHFENGRRKALLYIQNGSLSENLYAFKKQNPNPPYTVKKVMAFIKTVGNGYVAGNQLIRALQDEGSLTITAADMKCWGLK